jgi:uncharacterized membrane protein YeaQ/YmgE (transglycosylase-associated protein family)
MPAGEEGTTLASIGPREQNTMIQFAIFGLIVGIIAKLLTPGRDPGGCIVTMILGMLGSVVGGWLSRTLLHGSGQVGWIGSIVGTVVLLLVWRMVAGRRA